MSAKSGTANLGRRNRSVRLGGHDVLRVPLLGRFLRWRHSRTVMQLVMLCFGVLVIYDGFVGPTLAPKNLAGVLPWVQWRGILVLGLLVFGNLFCMACPFMLPRRLAKRLLPGRRSWPSWIPGKWVAVVLLILFFYAYETFSLWSSPWLTAWIAVGYFATAFVVDGLFKGAAFCKHVCPIGQFNFVNSLASPLEVGVRDPRTCADCTTKDCITGRLLPDGSHRQTGCELWLFQPGKVGNMDCTFCLDCVHACPWDNVGILTRNPASDLTRRGVRSGIGRLSTRTDLTALILVIVFGAFMNAFGMISPVYRLEAWLGRQPGFFSPYEVLLVIFGVGLVLLPVLAVTMAAWASCRAGGDALLGHRRLMPTICRFSWTLVPMGFGMWLAHYGYHFLTGALTIVPVMQSFLADFGIHLFGAPNWALAEVLPLSWINWIQLGFLSLGLIGSLVVVQQLAREQWSGRRARRAALPWAILCLLLFAAGIWLISQPMDMRGTLMG